MLLNSQNWNKITHVLPDPCGATRAISKVRSLMRQKHVAERAKALPILAFNLHRNIGSLEDTSEEMRKLRIMLDKESLKEEIKKLQKKLSNLDKVDGEAFIQQYEEEYGEEPEGSEEKRKGNNQEDQEEAEQKEERMEAKNPRREVKRKQAPKGTNTKEDNFLQNTIFKSLYLSNHSSTGAFAPHRNAPVAEVQFEN
ncbi:UNVERIFIED_CONTAM: hypothetical protein FKN15_075055 [Acipenser sinensis]